MVSCVRDAASRHGHCDSRGDGFCRIEADVPLAEMFAYSNVLRSATQGKAEFSMEFEKYARVPDEVSKALIEKFTEKK